MMTRRQFSASIPWLTAAPFALSGCSPDPAGDDYEAVAERTWQMGSLKGFKGVALSQELVRYATLAPSSHNTQCWKFALDDGGHVITILPDLARRCPVVDPDEHHLFVTLADAAFVNELKTWIRFNGTDAVRRRDGLYSVSSGNPNIPSWVGDVAFRWLLSAKGENDKYTRQVRSSAGIAVFVGQTADKAHWVEVGRCYERFALQATALGIRNAFLNQPVEVASLRPPFAAALGLTGQRPDLVVRFGRGALLPRSLRRPIESVLV